MPEEPVNKSTNPIINLLNRLIRDVKTHREDQMKNTRRSLFDISRTDNFDTVSRKSGKKKSTQKTAFKLPAVPPKIDFKKPTSFSKIGFDLSTKSVGFLEKG